MVLNFDSKIFKARKTATHLGVTLIVLDFNFETLESSLQLSPTHFLEVGAGASFFLLMPTVVVPPAATGIAVLNFRYYELLEDVAYGLKTMDGVKILDVMRGPSF